MNVIYGSVRVKVAVGMKAQINPSTPEGHLHVGREFLIAGEPTLVEGKECVPLNNLNGTLFHANYALSMLQITDTDIA